MVCKSCMWVILTYDVWFMVVMQNLSLKEYTNVNFRLFRQQRMIDSDYLTLPCHSKCLIFLFTNLEWAISMWDLGFKLILSWNSCLFSLCHYPFDTHMLVTADSTANDQSFIKGGNMRRSVSLSPWTSTLIPTPAGTHPCPIAASSATFAANPEQCIGSTYVGAGLIFSERKFTVGAIRSKRSMPARCNPPMT